MLKIFCNTQYKTFLPILVLVIIFHIPFNSNKSFCQDNDSVIVVNENNIASLDTLFKGVHSPRIASLYSAVLPGLGQVYNKKYWKVPIIYAGFATIFYALNFNNRFYLHYKNAAIWKESGDPNVPSEYAFIKDKVYTVDNLSSAFNYYKRSRDLAFLGLLGFYVINIIDATVDAYLIDYDISQNLALRLKPTVIQSPFAYNAGISLSLDLK
jgi:hypothetical protein